MMSHGMMNSGSLPNFRADEGHEVPVITSTLSTELKYDLASAPYLIRRHRRHRLKHDGPQIRQI